MRLIDADVLMHEYAKFVRRSNNHDFADVPTWNDAVSLAGSAPTIYAAPMLHAKTLVFYHGGTNFSYSCGVCHLSIDKNDHYCRHCGAKLDGGDVNG